MRHGLADDFVSIPKGDARTDQIISQVGCGGKALQRCLPHGLFVGLDCRDHIRKCPEAVFNGGHGVK